MSSELAIDIGSEWLIDIGSERKPGAGRRWTNQAI